MQVLHKYHHGTVYPGKKLGGYAGMEKWILPKPTRVTVVFPTTDTRGCSNYCFQGFSLVHRNLFQGFSLVHRDLYLPMSFSLLRLKSFLVFELILPM